MNFDRRWTESACIREMARADRYLPGGGTRQPHRWSVDALEGGKRRNVKHAAVLGITVAGWRGSGIGHQALGGVYPLGARTRVISRVELHVFVA